jgi:hypothetical protein
MYVSCYGVYDCLLQELIARADPERLGKIGWKNFCVAMGVVLIKLKM